jgi:hypothetical protein
VVPFSLSSFSLVAYGELQGDCAEGSVRRDWLRRGVGTCCCRLPEGLCTHCHHFQCQAEYAFFEVKVLEFLLLYRREIVNLWLHCLSFVLCFMFFVCLIRFFTHSVVCHWGREEGADRVLSHGSPHCPSACQGALVQHLLLHRWSYR